MSVDSVRVALPLFQAAGGGSIPTSTLQLRIEQISYEKARELNALWHSRLPIFATGFIKRQPFLCFGAVHCGLIYGIAIWSNPVACNLPQQEWMELRRMAIAPDAPKNTASRMLAIMKRLIRRHYPAIKKLISYQDCEVHTGTIYRAAGWKATRIHQGGSWSRPNSRNANGTPRTRPDLNKATGSKQRWEIELC